MTALVTGANRGTGLSLVQALLERGAAKVYATARDLLRLPGLHARYGDRFVGVELDLIRPKRIAEVAEMASDVQLVINNANVAIGEEIVAAETFDNARYEMEVNFFGPLQLLTHLTPALAANGDGVFVNISSVAGLTGRPYFPSYSASMAALHSLTQAARIRLATEDIRVVGVYPSSREAELGVEPMVELTSPGKMAEAILDGIERGEEDIYPDKWAIGFAERYLGSSKAAEREAAARVVKPALVN